MSAQAKQPCAAVLRRAQVGEPFRAAKNDVRDAGESFGVIDDSRSAPQPDYSREGGTNPWHAALAFERLHESRLFADFVRACAAMPVNFEIAAAAKYFFPEKPLRVRIGDRF